MIPPLTNRQIMGLDPIPFKQNEFDEICHLASLAAVSEARHLNLGLSHVAMDRCGRWYGYTLKPVCDLAENVWVAGDGYETSFLLARVSPVLIDWRVTLAEVSP